MVSLRMKFVLCIVSIMLICALFYYLPASTLVFISMIPSLVYGIWSKRFFLVLAALFTFGTSFLLFWIMILNQTGPAIELLDLAIYLYRVLYPYQLNANLLEFIGSQWIWVISVFIFIIIIIGNTIKYNTFKIMIVFSYFIVVFATFYLIANVFCYIIPPLGQALFSIPYFAHFMIFMYGVLPFIVLVLTVMFLLTIYDYRERNNAGKDAKILKKKMGPRTMLIMKWAGVISLIIFALVAILLAV